MTAEGAAARKRQDPVPLLLRPLPLPVNSLESGFSKGALHASATPSHTNWNGPVGMSDLYRQTLPNLQPGSYLHSDLELRCFPNQSV